MTQEQQQKQTPNDDTATVVDLKFAKELNVKERHITLALAILENGNYDVRYLRHPPVVVQIARRDGGECFDDFKMVRGAAYGCVIGFDIYDIDAEYLKACGIDVEEDYLFGWAKSSETRVVSKKSIKLHAIIRGLIDQPTFHELNANGQYDPIGTTTGKILPKDITKVIKEVVDS